MQILKLGGSILTDRESYCVFAPEHVQGIAAELKPYVGSLLLVHGMGSFGRAFLPLYSGKRIPGKQATLARRIQQNLRLFHELVLNQLISSGISVCSLDPEALFVVRNGAIIFANLEIVSHILRQGRLPVLYGGTVWDESGYFTILSSDQIVEWVGRASGATRVVWATDVDGVLSRSASGEVSVIPILSEENLDSIWRQESDETDCTGGMINKVGVSLRLAHEGIPSIVLNGRLVCRVGQALAGAQDSGTLVSARRVLSSKSGSSTSTL